MIFKRKHFDGKLDNCFMKFDRSHYAWLIFLLEVTDAQHLLAFPVGQISRISSRKSVRAMRALDSVKPII
jgi:hypothetical protein